MKRVRIKPRGVSILDTMADPQLFAPWFKDTQTWIAWTAFLAALFALDMTDEQRTIYRKCTGRDHLPHEPAQEAWLVIGRRGGKSFIMALVAVFLAAFRNYKPFLSPGERATIMLVAADRRQARIVLRYIRALLTHVAMLSRLIERETQDGFELSNQVSIEVHTASFRSTRGYSLAGIICDELAFWPTDETSAEPDKEILNALRPGMATIPRAMLICASSPYSRKGELWTAYRKHYGQDHDPILVWQSDTRTMNPTVPQRVIDQAMEADGASANAEYGAVFRSDVEAFIPREVVESCITEGVRERPWEPGRYVAFTDPSGGGSDSFTLAIGHRSDATVIIDAIREVRPRFSPHSVVTEFADLLKSYSITSVTGDRYAGEWPRERFREHGIKYEVAEKPKSQLYQALLPQLNAGSIQLLDHPRLVSQLCSLERRTARGGRDSIDHPPGAGNHDDVANVVAGVASMLTLKKSSYDTSLGWVMGDNADDEKANYLMKMAGVHRFG